MKTIKLSQALRPLAEYAAALRDEIVVLTERNRVVAAIVPLKKADRESVALSRHPEFLKIIERSRADFRSGRVISLEAMKNELKMLGPLCTTAMFALESAARSCATAICTRHYSPRTERTYVA